MGKKSGASSLGCAFDTSPEDAMDAAQDLYRAAGQYPKAADVLQGWLSASPEDPRALELLGGFTCWRVMRWQRRTV